MSSINSSTIKGFEGRDEEPNLKSCESFPNHSLGQRGGDEEGLGEIGSYHESCRKRQPTEGVGSGK